MRFEILTVVAFAKWTSAVTVAAKVHTNINLYLNKGLSVHKTNQAIKERKIEKEREAEENQSTPMKNTHTDRQMRAFNLCNELIN